MKEFAGNVREAVLEKLGDGYDIGIMEKQSQVGLAIKADGATVGPVIYVNDFFNKFSVEETAEQVINIYNEYKDCRGLDSKDVINKLQDWEYVTENLEVRLLSNTFKADVFISAEKFGFDNLILVPFIKLGKQGEQMLTTQVNKQLFEYWDNDCKADDLVNIGLINAKKEAIHDHQFDYAFDVITNRERRFGAISAIAMRDELRQKYPNGYYVIPSSVHEVIILPNNCMPLEDVTDFVKMVNATKVAPNEVLSNHAYEIKS